MRLAILMVLVGCSSIDTTAEQCNPFTQQHCPDFRYEDGGVHKGRCCPRASTCTSALQANQVLSFTVPKGEYL